MVEGTEESCSAVQDRGRRARLSTAMGRQYPRVVECELCSPAAGAWLYQTPLWGCGPLTSPLCASVSSLASRECSGDEKTKSIRLPSTLLIVSAGRGHPQGQSCCSRPRGRRAECNRLFFPWLSQSWWHGDSSWEKGRRNLAGGLGSGGAPGAGSGETQAGAGSPDTPSLRHL